MRVAPLLIVVSVAVSASACGGSDDESATTTTEVVPSGQIDLSLDPVELSPEFPSDVPIPADLVILGSEVLDGETRQIFEVTGWHEGEAIRLARDYEAVLEGLGYEITNRSETPDKLFFNAERVDWFISAGFFPDPIRLEGTSVGLTVVPVSPD
jgi:hypothetical protein